MTLRITKNLLCAAWCLTVFVVQIQTETLPKYEEGSCILQFALYDLLTIVNSDLWFHAGSYQDQTSDFWLIMAILQR